MLAREALDLTPEQEKALEEFRKARAEEGRAFRDEMAKVRAERRELAKDPKANQAKLDALIDRTAKLRAEREKAAFRNRIERDKIFTPEQREKMKTFRETAGQPSGPDRPRPDGRRPPGLRASGPVPRPRGRTRAPGPAEGLAPASALQALAGPVTPSSCTGTLGTRQNGDTYPGYDVPLFI